MVSVSINGDTTVEQDERFGLVLSGVSGATYDADNSDPYGRIRDDDSPATLTVYGDASARATPARSQLSFEIDLSHPVSTDVTFHYATADDTATAGSDYVATSGDVTIAAGDTYAEVSVSINGRHDRRAGRDRSGSSSPASSAPPTTPTTATPTAASATTTPRPR